MWHLAAAFFMVLAWLIPNHYRPWTSFYNESCMAVGLVLMAAGNGRCAIARPLPAAAWVVSAAASIPVFQWMFGQLAFSGDAIVAALYLLGLASAIAIGYAAASANPKGTAAMLAFAALAASVVSCCLALVQALGGLELGLWLQPIPSGGRAFANLGQPNNLATLIGFGAVGLLLLREQNRCSRALASVLLGVLLIGAGLTQSRSALAFGPLIAMGLYVARRNGGAFTTTVHTVVLAAAVHWAITWSWPALQASLLLGASQSLQERGVGSVRFEMWPILLNALWVARWHGYGWLQVGEAELASVNAFPPVGEMWQQAHNVFLDLLLWCGVPLGALLIALLSYWWVSRLRLIRTKEAVAGFMTVTVLGMHSMLELPHHYAYFLIPAGLWIGQIEWSIVARGWGSGRWNLLPQALALFLMLGIWRDYGEIEADTRLARFEDLRIGSLHAAQPAPDAAFMSSLTESLRFMRTAPQTGMSAAELERMSAVVRRYPEALSLFRYANALAMNDRMPEARESFVAIRHMFGEKAYAMFRVALRERIAQGQTDLRALENSLPN